MNTKKRKLIKLFKETWWLRQEYLKRWLNWQKRMVKDEILILASFNWHAAAIPKDGTLSSKSSV